MQATIKTTGKALQLKVTGVKGAARILATDREGFEFVVVLGTDGTLRGMGPRGMVSAQISCADEYDLLTAIEALPLRQTAPRSNFAKR